MRARTPRTPPGHALHRHSDRLSNRQPHRPHQLPDRGARALTAAHPAPPAAGLLALLALALLTALLATGCATVAAHGPTASSANAIVGVDAAGDPEVVVNVPAQELTLYLGGRPAAVYPVTVGTPAHPTPIGEFTLKRAIWNPWWHPPKRAWAQGSGPQPPGPDNAMGRVKIYFKPLYFLHGTAATEDLGEPASHGCIRLSNGDIIELARRLHRYATPELERQVLAALEADPEENREIVFDRPVPLRIVYELVEIDGDRLVVHPDVYRRVGPGELTRQAEEALSARGMAVSQERLRELVADLHQDGGSVTLDRLRGDAVAATGAAVVEPPP